METRMHTTISHEKHLAFKEMQRQKRITHAIEVIDCILEETSENYHFEIYLFGSVARNSFALGSDTDILILYTELSPTLEKSLIRECSGESIDIKCYNTKDFFERSDNFSTKLKIDLIRLCERKFTMK